jgi:8-oxo-dGTP diphosphatase
MNSVEKQIKEIFGNRIRIRIMGLLIQNDKILLIKHSGLGSDGYIYLPPGGEMQFGETARHALEREFMEETNLRIAINKFLFLHEFREKPLHADKAMLGKDPEMKSQILQEIKWFSAEECLSKNEKYFHQIFGKCNNFTELLTLKGYFLNGNTNFE